MLVIIIIVIIIVIVIQDNSAEQIEEAKKKMGPTAEEYFAKNKGNDDSVVFMYTDGSDLDARLLEFINMKGLKCPKLALVHFSVQKKYVCEDDPIDVAKFLEDYKTGKCSAVGLKE